ncbi:MAG: hypothetical protein H6Q69_1257 [Firmicutes bacterium]|nr:hypothetical protein [Bacillota bacterium]
MPDCIHVFGTFPNISYVEYKGCQTRNPSTITLVQETIKINAELFENKKLDFFIYTEDRSEDAERLRKKLNLKTIFAFHTTPQLKDTVIPIPDFTYIGWPECGLTTWEEVVASCHERASKPYDMEQCFWIGNVSMHKTREVLCELAEQYPQLLKAVGMGWKSNTINFNADTMTTQYVSLPDHAKYKFLIDIRGLGWSGRLKFLLHLKRPIIIVDRPYQEFYFPYLKPFQNYIPVQADLSDFIEKLKWLNENKEEYRKICLETEKFAQQYLSKKFAMKYLCEMIQQYGIVKKIFLNESKQKGQVVAQSKNELTI